MSASLSELDESDFFLVLMFPFQVQLAELVKKENSVITIDATHGLTSKLQLVTVLTLDEWREGKPLAFFITRRTDGVALEYFYNSIKQKLGYPLLPRLVMTDDASQFYNSWRNVMGGDPKKFLCAWHINKNWKQKLISKIPDKDLRAETRDLLFELRAELDPDVFEYLNEAFIDFLDSDDGLSEFLEYYQTYYYHRSEFLAYCHLPNDCVNTNNHIEKFHQTLKHSYCDGKTMLRLDSTIHILRTIIDDHEHETKRRLVFGHANNRTRAVIDAHETASSTISSYEINLLDVSDFEDADKSKQHFLVKSLEKGTSYLVTKTNKRCRECKFACSICKTCHHEFTCQCHQYRVKVRMCKHLHMVAMKQELATQPENDLQLETDDWSYCDWSSPEDANEEPTVEKPVDEAEKKRKRHERWSKMVKSLDQYEADALNADDDVFEDILRSFVEQKKKIRLHLDKISTVETFFSKEINKSKRRRGKTVESQPRTLFARRKKQKRNLFLCQM